MQSLPSVVMIGATGAVGGHTATTLAQHPQLQKLTLLGRREADIKGDKVIQHKVDLMDPNSYKIHLAGHRAAICTVGVGEPSKVDKATFTRIDKDLVLDFATSCKEAGVEHFSLLSSVGVSASSSSFFLRTKGELEDALRALNFTRLSLFHPSMILTPTNRYGTTQALTLAIWPKIKPLLLGPLRPYRGVRVKTLGQSFAHNLTSPGSGEEILTWDDFQRLTRS